MGKPRKSVNLPVAEMVSVVIVIYMGTRNSLGLGWSANYAVYYLFIYLFATKNYFIQSEIRNVFLQQKAPYSIERVLHKVKNCNRFLRK
jgi:hypothetical protein